MHYRFVLAASTLVLLVGCVDKGACPFSGCVKGGPQGGGGGGGGLITIDRNNALPALREAWYAAMTTPAIAAFVEATGVGEVSSGTVVVDPNGPTAYNCPVSGTFTVTGNVADPNTVTAGDFINYESSACDSGTGYRVDGEHSVDIASIAGDYSAGQYELAQNLGFIEFQAATTALATTLNGDHSAVTDTRGSGAVTVAFSGNSLRINEGQVAITMRNYSGFASISSIAPFTLTLETGGDASSSIAGSFIYSTDEPIYQELGNNAFDGILDIFGNGPGTARIAVVDAATVDVQVDSNGSTNYEVSVQMTWDEFLNGTATAL